MSEYRLRMLEREARNGGPFEQKCLLDCRVRYGLDKRDYVLLPRSGTYALALQCLRGECESSEDGVLQPRIVVDNQELIRPLSFKETLEARVVSYINAVSDDERLVLFNFWNDTCTGVLYKVNSSMFKVVPISRDLISLPSGFNQASITGLDYDLIDGFELDRNDANYDRLLTSDEVIRHPGWLASVENDLNLLKEYVDIVFFELNRENGMRFWVLNKPKETILRALCVSNISGNSGADGYYLNGIACFVRVAQYLAPQVTR